MACGIRTGERKNNDPTNHCEIRLAPSFLSDEESTGQDNEGNVVAIYLKLNRWNFSYLFAKSMLRLNKNIFLCVRNQNYKDMHIRVKFTEPFAYHTGDAFYGQPRL